MEMSRNEFIELKRDNVFDKDTYNITKLFSSKKKAQEMPKVVYHYCSFESFISIIENSTIRLSNIVKSNDLEEITYILPTLKNIVKKIASYYNSKSTVDFKINFSSDYIDSLFSPFNKTLYVTCFSESKDSLSQWARYADDGKGIAIGFSTIPLIQLQINNNSEFTFNKVIYNDNNVEAYVIDNMKKELDKLWGIDEAKNQNNLVKLISNFSDSMLTYSSLFKNPGFNEEREWRLIYNPFGRIRNIIDKYAYIDVMNDTGNRKFQDIKISNIKFLKNHHGLTTFLELDFDKIKNFLIKEIVLGPMQPMEIDNNELQLFFQLHGYNTNSGGVKIFKSYVPYYSNKAY